MVPGSVALTMPQVHALESIPNHPPRTLAIVGGHVLNVCHSMKNKEILGCIADIFKHSGHCTCMCLARIAAYPNEDTDQDPVDDVVLTKDILKKAGFPYNGQCACCWTIRLTASPP